MPVHDLKCNDCGSISDIYINLKEKKDLKCNKCGSCNCHIYYGNFSSNNFGGITYYKDIGNYGKYITSREIDKKCKEQGLVYGSNDDITRAAAKNRERLKKVSAKRDEVLVDKIEQVFKEKIK